MGREEAIRGIVIVSLYFIVLSIILFGIAFISNEYSLTDSGFTSSGSNVVTNFESGGFCSTPRFMTETFFSNKHLGNDPRYKTMFDHGYILDEATCDTLEGCQWVEESSLLHTITFGWLGSTSFVARGVIDSTFYNDGVDYDVMTTALQVWNKPVYNLALLQADESLCEQFGFTWTREETFTSEAIGVTGIFRTTLSMFRMLFEVTTLRFSFGNIPTILNTLLVFMFIWAPLIYFLGCIYVMLR